jgi:hypothetical protein
MNWTYVLIIAPCAAIIWLNIWHRKKIMALSAEDRRKQAQDDESELRLW